MIASYRPASLKMVYLWRLKLLLEGQWSATLPVGWRHQSSGQETVPKPFADIPGPPPLPLVGNIWRYFPVVGEFDVSRFHVNFQKMLLRYGPLVKEVVFGTRTVVHVFQPDDIEAVFRHEGRFPLRCSHRALLQYRLDRPDLYNGGGLFPSNGEEWYRYRVAFQQPLLQPRNVNAYTCPLAAVSDDLVSRVREMRDRQGEVRDFQPELYKWSTECTGVLTLNRRLGCLMADLDCDSDAANLIHAAAVTHEAVMTTENRLPLWKVLPTPTYRKLVTAQDVMARVVGTYLEEAVAAVQRGDQQEEATMLRQFLTIQEVDLKDIFTMILDLFLAGIDTTAIATGFALYHLARHPDAQDRLREEVTAILPTRSSELTPSSFDNTPYLKACIKESMRLNPVAIGSGRVLTQDVVLSDYTVPAGTMVIAQNQVACRQASNFDDPLAFRPDRWLKGNPCAERVHPFLLLPFGYGPRMCIGRRFAVLEMCVLLVKLIRNFRLECDIETLDCVTRLINVPDQPLKLRFRDVDL